MRGLGGNARKVLERPGAFALAVLKHFRANQGLLLAGAVAYYALLSIVPLLILILMALTHVFEADRLLQTLRDYLEFVVPGQSNALVRELQAFLEHREVMGWILLGTLLFFSALAFTVNGSTFRYGHFLNVLIAFVTIAFVVFFFVVKPINRLMELSRRRESPDPTTRKCPQCLSEIPIDAHRCAFCTSEVAPV